MKNPCDYDYGSPRKSWGLKCETKQKYECVCTAVLSYFAYEIITRANGQLCPAAFTAVCNSNKVEPIGIAEAGTQAGRARGRPQGNERTFETHAVGEIFFFCLVKLSIVMICCQGNYYFVCCYNIKVIIF